MSRVASRSLAIATLAVTTAVAFPATASATPIATPSSADDDSRHVARAREEPRSSGPRLALRTGFAVPIGQTFAASGAIDDTVTGYVPVRLDLGYRIAHHFYVGVAAQLADVVPSGCTSGMSCSGSDLRFGVMVAYHLLPRSIVDPWLGIGMGFEQLTVSRSIGDAR